MESALSVAKWFLSKKELTHKQIQKLCYYAQAWHLALLNKPLFEDEIQAWIHGPVIPSLYPYFADYRWLPIPRREEKPSFDAATEEVLEAVYRTYGKFSGDQLEYMSHRERPWQEARQGTASNSVCTNPISHESMRKYFGTLYEQAQND